LPQSVRWDSATSADGGLSWKTDWIMEFSRTRPASEVTQDELLSVPWTAGKVSPHAEARALDWLLGTWTGVQEDEGGTTREARLRVKTLDKDCLVLDVLETRALGATDWDERLMVRGFEARPRAWTAWSVSDRDSTLRRWAMTRDGEGFLFAHERADGSRRSEYLMPLGDDEIVIDEQRFAPGTSDPLEVRTTTLRRE
jgi:YD repeat-containing protein